MKIESVRIENFRSFNDETINFDNYSCFVGANGAGKSTVLYALNVFFRQFKDSQTDLNKLVESDFHHRDTSKDIKITVTFSDINNDAKNDFSHYVRQGKLIISAIAKFDSETGNAQVKQYGSRLGFKDFVIYFEKDKSGSSANDLKEIYKKIKGNYPDLPAVSTKSAMSSALREYEASNSDRCSLIQSEDQFYGISKGTNLLAKYVQWVFVSGSKDVTEESEESKTSALGQLLARTVRSKVNFSDKISKLQKQTKLEYQNLLDEEQSTLNDISKSLESRLASWAHPEISAEVKWKQDPDKTIKIDEPWAYIRIGERGFEADLARFGHGLQRSYMLALLQELSLIDDETAPTLIMGIEEPELYQHPPQARYLSETLLELSEKDSQLILCTHNPLFIPGDNFDKVRIVREQENPNCTTVSQLLYEDLAKKLEEIGENLLKETGIIAKLYPSLNPVINEMFFCKRLVLVEGQEDLSFLTSSLMLNNKISDFRKYGCHIVPVNGKSNLKRPLAIANLLEIPTFVVFDADTDLDEPSVIVKHKKDNKAILALQGHIDENNWPDSNIIKDNLFSWKTNICNEIKSEVAEDWSRYQQEAEDYYGNPGGLNKNPLAIAKILEKAWSEGNKSDLLNTLVDKIISFAAKN